jgi:entericidin B
MQAKIAAPPVAFAALVALFALTACNTVKGAGQDVQAGGAAVEDAATETQQEMQK